MTHDEAELEERLDRVTTELLVPLRTSKHLDPAAMAELFEITDTYAEILSDRDDVNRELTGKLWFVFLQMLAEADHARDPNAILIPAWNYADRLRRIYGPRWDDPSG